MRYKKIQAISWQGNFSRNIILRQQFALEFLKLDLREKNIINVDETWIGITDNRKMRWAMPGKSNSVRKKQLQPRISMVVGLDSHGFVYTALTQANSNSQVMKLFFTHFVQLMDKKNAK